MAVLFARRALSALLLALAFLSAAAAQEADPAAFDQALRALAADSFDDKEKAIAAFAALDHPRVEEVLAFLRAGDLYARKDDGAVVIAERADGGYALTDPSSGEALGAVGRRDVEKVRVNNRLRRAIDAALGARALQGGDASAKRAAAARLFRDGGSADLAALEAALEAETDAETQSAFADAIAAITLRDDARAEDERLEALKRIEGLSAATPLMSRIARGEGALADAARQGLEKSERRRAFWRALQNIAYGLSLGSVLLLAAIGLAITFGVMGVINLAHGELVMLGAYATFVTQELFRAYLPGYVDLSLLVAIPAAFLTAGLVGVLIERGVIRFLYGRPLETLLATWGVSLILQQAVRSIFGPTNREVANPSWMSGAVEVGDLTLTWNRIWIFLFALAVFAFLLFVLKKTRFGLYARAVTQNRAMAEAMGVRSSRIDALAFGLGSGIAGLAGVALSQIDNTSPNLGQAYVVDSFLVVVFGGVGNLWGALTGAFTLGVVNKFIEPWTGAVLAKIAVLVFIVLFIQRRPQGLFPQRGRAAEH